MSTSIELQAWLDGAGRIPRITPEQEILLGRQVQAAAGLPREGRTAEQERIARRALRAQQRLAEANLRLVFRIVEGQYGRLVSAHQLTDLLQVGAEGCFHAASKFDPEAGYRFSTYAANWIRQRCQQELDKMGRPIRAPSTIAPQLRRLSRVRAELEQEHQRPATVPELAEALRLGEEEVRLALERLRPMASLDQQVGADGTSRLEDWVASPAPEEGVDLQALAVLSPMERQAVLAAYGIGPHTVKELAALEGVSARLLQQIATQAIRRLRAGTTTPAGRRVVVAAMEQLSLGLWLDHSAVMSDTVTS
jgi:RNA polymerase sigma factor (sigma-70 family)